PSITHPTSRSFSHTRLLAISSHSLGLSLSPCYKTLAPLVVSLSPMLTLSLTHTHAHSLSLSLTLSLTHTLSLSHSLSLSHTHSLSLSHTHTPHTLTHTL